MSAFLSEMAVFAKVVEADSLTAAARMLGVSKSSVSKTLARIEHRLGTRLINRTTRRLSLTEAGAVYYEGCQRALNEAAAAERAVEQLSAAPRGLLRVNAPMSFGLRQLAGLLPDFLMRYPDIDLDMTLDDRIVDLIDAGYDLAIRITALEDSSLIARRLAPNHRVLCAAPAYLEAHGALARPEALASRECLLYHYQVSGNTWHLVGPAGEARAIRVTGRLRMNSGEALYESACRGLGIAHLPTFICGDALRDGRLRRVLPDWADAFTTAIHAVYPSGAPLPPKARAFIDFLVEQFGACPAWDEGLAV